LEPICRKLPQKKIPLAANKFEAANPLMKTGGEFLYKS
jgi:hypothetical protein